MEEQVENKVLIVEDEESILTLLQFHLEKAGFHVTAVMDGKEALKIASTEKFNVIVLDWMLPSMDGMEVCKHLRINRNTTPILMLTAKDEEFDKILGLELGADDYMTKPFSPREVVARIKALIRRTSYNQDAIVEDKKTEEEIIIIGQIQIYPERYEAIYRGNQMECTPKEFELLTYLARNKGRVLTRDQLLDSVWNYEFSGDTRIVDVHVSNLREKIEEDTRKPLYIKTIRGLGYKMEEPKLHE